MPAPINKKQVWSFIGMINYLSKCSARLSEIAEPIQELAKDNVPFNWGPEHQSVFTQMKQEFISAPILAYYNLRKNCLANWCNPQGFRCMSSTRRKTSIFWKQSTHKSTVGYTAIELESLAVAWVMEKFHHFLYASHIILETDQKPLEAILSKISIKLHQGYKESW